MVKKFVLLCVLLLPGCCKGGEIALECLLLALGYAGQEAYRGLDDDPPPRRLKARIREWLSEDEFTAEFEGAVHTFKVVKGSGVPRALLPPGTMVRIYPRYVDADGNHVVQVIAAGRCP